jgi:perosamine synthetase
MSGPNRNLQAASTRIPITRPFLDQCEEQAVLQVLRSGWLVQGPRVAEFEEQFKKYVDAKYAIATSSCTTALHIALLAAGIGPGDEVLMPSFTFVATANAVEYTGAKPVFVDINLNTFTINPSKVAEYLDLQKAKRVFRPKCILPVSLFGLCADMEALKGIADHYGLLIIEDAACAFGATREGRHAGTEALAACFSFHPRKAITTGEGGMVITDDKALEGSLKRLRDHGASKTDRDRHLTAAGAFLPDFDRLGFNYRMTDLQGAIGCAQMKKAQAILAARRTAANRYDAILKTLPRLKLPQTPKGHTHAYQSYVCLLNGQELIQGDSPPLTAIEEWGKSRDLLMAKLEGSGISVRQGTHAVHELGFYREKYKLRPMDFPMSHAADRISLTLPLYVGISEEDQLRVKWELEMAIKDSSGR